MDIERAKLEALNEVYLDACSRRDYRTCDIVRQQIAELLSGKKQLITLDDTLNLNPDDIVFS